MKNLVISFVVLSGSVSVMAQGFIPQAFGLNQVPILSQTSEIQPDGSFYYSYETGNGIQAQAEGALKPVPVVRPDGFPDSTLAVVQAGSYRYTAPDGSIVEVRWTADENGFHPVVNRIPAQPAFLPGGAPLGPRPFVPSANVPVGPNGPLVPAIGARRFRF